MSFPVTQFQHPKLRLPLPLMMSEPGSFANLTLNQRMPAIVRRVMAENRFSAEIIANLETLIQDLADGQIRLLQDNGSDVAAWAENLAPYLGKRWVEIPWFFAEVYLFRRILEATQYFQPGDWQGVDPYATQKQAGLETALADIRAISRQLDANGTEADQQANLVSLLYSVLWGNRADLSLQPLLSAAGVQQEIEAEVEQRYVLANNIPVLLDWWQERSLNRIDVIADNAGFELVCDLFLVDFLLSRGLVETIVLHLKEHPTFVSDATIQDFHLMLQTLASDSEPTVQTFVRRLESYLTSGQLQLRDAPFWTAPLVFWQMPASMRQELAPADLVFIKGDANYRRLLGDCHWDFTIPFADIVCYFPTPLVALRTLKSEVAAGLQPDQIETLDREESEWLTSGRWGVIQIGNIP
jgi:hypothetical protein